MTFVGGKLNLKGGARKKKRSSKKKRRSGGDVIDPSGGGSAADGSATGEEDGLTDAERRALKFKQAAERRDLEKVGERSHRERVEAFNSHLSTLTEHNDIPRVSAAGNG
mmetsp:Transcript_4927/g.10409  ORF Transcript_4927/g.10409 Transcript_4927/m.10409 type:complete len:109 (-) Transcript_4927:123-449(-)|eukprot:CAMPEP_0194323338 /NCGR_PEP_ID=MMETSP0171-20130528/25297_1 /TAXON_ID=218684 /ORGANISM="Corethron pennatum, Strain L29A3" /LENGTH=108 /DNA_ID=CAMNT_0039081961 /DNA_START=107 /DNA_END=433 /DNA_ORIENTATION=+